ncbi:hypothetical protein GYMLUDRAFT_130580, partial [Collybiopsis luxurians FD-317 M1]
STISQTLLNTKKDIADYKLEIRSLQIHISEMRTRRTQLKVYKASLKSLLSPIRRLPNELLYRIFGLTYSTNHLVSRDHQILALAISSVCTRWRQLALSSPDLWSSMDIY